MCCRYLFLFLKFVATVIPTIEYDYTMDFDLGSSSTWFMIGVFCWFIVNISFAKKQPTELTPQLYLLLCKLLETLVLFICLFATVWKFCGNRRELILHFVTSWSSTKYTTNLFCYVLSSCPNLLP